MMRTQFWPCDLLEKSLNMSFIRGFKKTEGHYCDPVAWLIIWKKNSLKEFMWTLQSMMRTQLWPCDLLEKSLKGSFIRGFKKTEGHNCDPVASNIF